MNVDDTLSPRDREVVAHLVAGYTWGEISDLLPRCSRSTVARVSERHRDLIAREREARARRTADRLQGATTAALDCLLDLLRNANQDAVKLGAAKAILDGALKWADAISVDERLAAVEARLGLRAVT